MWSNKILHHSAAEVAPRAHRQVNLAVLRTPTEASRACAVTLLFSVAAAESCMIVFPHLGLPLYSNFICGLYLKDFL